MLDRVAEQVVRRVVAVREERVAARDAAEGHEAEGAVRAGPRQDDPDLGRHARIEGAYLGAPFGWHHIEHRLPGGVSHACQPKHLHKAERDDDEEDRRNDQPTKAE